MRNNIPILTGDPGYACGSSDKAMSRENGWRGASFVRFAVPLKYKLERLGSEAQSRTGQLYRPLVGPEPGGEPTSSERRTYFTGDLTKSLFERTQWFELGDCVDNAPSPKDRFPEWAQTDGEPVCMHFHGFAEGGEGPKSEAKAEVVSAVPKRDLLVQLHRPRLVLMEAAKAWERKDGRSPSFRTSGDCPMDHDVLATGFLIVDVSFPRSQEGGPVCLQDLLLLGERLRYWREPWRGHREQVMDPLVGPSGAALLESGVAYFGDWRNKLEHPVMDQNGELWKVVPDTALQEASEWVKAAEKDFWPKKAGTGSGWICYSDGRAFVWTCALLRDKEAAKTLDSIAMSTGESDLHSSGSADRFHEIYFAGKVPSSGLWIRLVNVDGAKVAEAGGGYSLPGAHSTSAFEQRWVEPRTYLRWAHLGTYYGYSEHGACQLVSIQDGGPPLWRHFAGIYCDQALLLLYLRTTTFRFSSWLSDLSARAHSAGEADWHAFREEFSRLRWNFVLFTNLYEFPLLSSQQQGVEMYSIQREFLDVDSLFQEIQREVYVFDDYLSQRNSVDLVESAGRLGILGSFVALVGLLFASWATFDFFWAPMSAQGTPQASTPKFLLIAIAVLVVCWAAWIGLVLRSNYLHRAVDRWADRLRVDLRAQETLLGRVGVYLKQATPAFVRRIVSLIKG